MVPILRRAHPQTTGWPPPCHIWLSRAVTGKVLGAWLSSPCSTAPSRGSLAAGSCWCPAPAALRSWARREGGTEPACALRELNKCPFVACPGVLGHSGTRSRPFPSALASQGGPPNAATPPPPAPAGSVAAPRCQCAPRSAPRRALQHTNLLQCLAQCAEVTPYLLVMEFCPLVSPPLSPRSHRGAVASPCGHWSCRTTCHRGREARGTALPGLARLSREQSQLLGQEGSGVTVAPPRRVT